MPEDQRSSGPGQAETVLAGVRGWLHDGVQLLRVRLELLALEARDHATGLVELLLLGLAAVILLGVGLAFLAVLLTVLLWDSHRTLALAVFATLFLTVGAGALVLARSRWLRQQTWFEASAQEFKADAERLRP